MRRFFTSLFFLLCTGLAFAQVSERYARAEILLQGRSIGDLAALGLEVDHGRIRPGFSFTSDFSETELQRIRAAGFSVQVQIDDVGAYYALHGQPNSGAEQRSAGTCGNIGGPVFPTPANYTYGSMGGFHTYSELLAVLDSMHARFPTLISLRAPVSDTVLTHEGRPLWYLKLSDNPGDEEAEPKVLYTALHHSREPNGMSQMLYFMWYLLENYATNDRVKYIVDHNQLYFIPCLNPDGYVYNELIAPGGGGMWRKNRRLNSDGSYGVDLNRNYGYNWGWDDIGSSPTPNGTTYRGPSGFSEPETRMVRDFTEAQAFQFALNYHTWGNLLIYPWSYNDQLADSAFLHMARIMTRDNNFTHGTPSQTVGYTVNGSSDDWMYGAAGVYSMTPEVGNTGFWPSFDEIDPLNKSNVWPNLFLALSTGRYGEVRDLGDSYLTGPNAEVSFEIQRFGTEDGPLSVSLEPVSANIVAGPPAQLFDLDRFESAQSTFMLELASWIAAGDTVVFAYTVDNGSFLQRDTVYKIYGASAVAIFGEPGDNLDAWVGDWGLNDISYVSAPTSITDSPFDFYLPGTASFMALIDPLVIPAGVEAPRLEFFAHWNIEEDFDYVQVLATTPDGQSTPLCGLYTELASFGQPDDQPVYDGNQSDWVRESMDLSDFIGQTITLTFILISDDNIEGDGFYFDDLTVEYLQTTGIKTVLSLDQFRLSSSPNPASDQTTIRWQAPAGLSGAAELLVTNTLGQPVWRSAVDLAGSPQLHVDTRAWAPGLYTYVLRTAAGQTAAGKLVKE